MAETPTDTSPWRAWRHLLSGRTRFALRLARSRIIQSLRHANALDWVSGVVTFHSRAGEEYQVGWRGYDEGLSWLALLLDGERRTGMILPPGGPMARASRLLLPDALRVPVYINAVMDLTHPVEEIYSGCTQNIRRVIRRHLADCRYETVSTRQQVLEISNAMLRPYAESRHGATAAQLDDEEVVAFALGRSGGSLKVMVKNGQAVACQLGLVSEPFGVKTWDVLRLGYLPSVFNEPLMLDEINTLNAYLAAVDARARGFTQLNFGMSVARPDGGLLHWKCRRGCLPEPRTVTASLALSVPTSQRARFFAARPLFFIDGDSLNLAIGWPEGMTTGALRDLLRANHVRGVRRVLVYRSVAVREDESPLEEWLKVRDANCYIEYRTV